MDRNLLSFAMILMLVVTASSSGAGLARHIHADSGVAVAVASASLGSPGDVVQTENCAVVHCGHHVTFIAIPELVTPRASAMVSALPFTRWHEIAVTRDPEPPRT